MDDSTSKIEEIAKAGINRFSVYLFLVYKSIGTASTQPLMGEFTTDENRGVFSSKYFMYYSMATIIAISAVFGLTFYNQSLHTYQIIIFAGAMIELIASCLFISMKETNVPRQSARSLSVRRLLKNIWTTKEYRYFLMGRSFARAGLILIVPISILALKNYGVSQYSRFNLCIYSVGRWHFYFIYKWHDIKKNRTQTSVDYLFPVA